MVTPTCSQDELLAILRLRFKEACKDVEIPPPVFKAMQAEIIAFDLDAGELDVRFPVLKEQLNPFGNMQGGMIAAMIDNTLGPLSMAVAPPNFTRHFELKYRSPVHPDIEHVIVSGRYIERKQRRLFFTASLTDCRGKELVSAKSVHWIIDEVDDAFL
ncbi:MAG: PaaI family thioesterase [Gammaproteobacteria bacterium]